MIKPTLVCLGALVLSSGCAAEIVAVQAARMTSIAIDDSHVYWTARHEHGPNRVMKAPKAGGAAITLARSEHVPHGVVVDRTHVYWSSRDRTIRRVPKEGGAEEVLFSGRKWETEADMRFPQFHSGPIAVDDEFIYWEEHRERSRIVRVPKTGGERTVLTTSNGWARHFALDATHLYWIEELSGEVLAVAKSGGSPRMIAEKQRHPRGLALDDTHLYWSREPYSSDEASVLKTPKGGGPIEVVARGGDPRSLALGARYVFWTDMPSRSRHKVLRAANRGGGVGVITRDRIEGPIAADSTHVYWVTGRTYGGEDFVGRMQRVRY